jgi:hypothetical protein
VRLRIAILMRMVVGRVSLRGRIAILIFILPSVRNHLVRWHAWHHDAVRRCRHSGLGVTPVAACEATWVVQMPC